MDPWLFRRISVRYLVDGQAFDVIGRVLHRTSDVVQLMRRDGQIEDVPVVDIIAAREVPDDERRLRPVHDFPTEKLNEIIERAVHLRPPEQRVLIASCHELPQHATDTPSISLDTHVDEHWHGVVSREYGSSESGENPALPHVYLRVDDQGATRVVLAGDWLGLSPFAVANDSIDTAERLLAAAHTWAEPRGAVYAFVLLKSEQCGLAEKLLGLGFRDVSAVI